VEYPPKKSLLETVQGVNNPLRTEAVSRLSCIIAHHSHGFASFIGYADLFPMPPILAKKF
jgi:hypothetical protein